MIRSYSPAVASRNAEWNRAIKPKNNAWSRRFIGLPQPVPEESVRQANVWARPLSRLPSLPRSARKKLQWLGAQKLIRPPAMGQFFCLPTCREFTTLDREFPNSIISNRAMKNHFTRRRFIRHAVAGSAALTWLGS